MNRFIGREQELKTLNELYHTDKFQMVVISGRRRVGKTTLISKFIEDKTAVYFSAIKGNSAQNLALWSEQILNILSPDLNNLTFNTYEQLFTFLGKQCENRRIVIVIDELPYLAESNQSILSTLQNTIDHQWLNGQMFLILCGSSVSFMEEEVLSEKSPLFGRRTSQIKLGAFNYKEAALFVPNYNYEQKAICYGITGGIAKYLSFLDDSKSLDQNIIDLYFSKSGFLYEEPNNLLIQEFRNTSTYNNIILAIAQGSNKINEISNKTHIEATTISHALSNLITTGIVVKKDAITDEKNKRKSMYTLLDGMFKFWYRFIPNAISLIEIGQGELYYNRVVKNQLHDFMEEIFEEMCAYYTLESSIDDRYHCFITQVGKWWGTNPKTKEATDIDIVGIDTLNKVALLGECKFKNELLDKNIYEKLTDRSGLIDHKYRTMGYILFSKSGFTEWFNDRNDPNTVYLITLEDMYK